MSILLHPITLNLEVVEAYAVNTYLSLNRKLCKFQKYFLQVTVQWVLKSLQTLDSILIA